MSDDLNLNKTIIFKKFLVQEMLGQGAFGTVYSGIKIETKEKVALKFEKRDDNKNGTLELESFHLNNLQGEGIPKVYCYGKTHNHYVLVQELLGRSLDDHFKSCNKRFSLKTVCFLGIEIMKRIRFIHSKNYIHRDIKPDNFMLGKQENQNKLYLIDFGLSKKYFSTTKNAHIKFNAGKQLIGTARYCSKNAHRGYEQSRRDDLESVGYMLIYFLIGSLPWQGMKLRNGEDLFQKIAEQKMATTFEILCNGYPDEFVTYFKYVEGLGFEEQPEYDFLISLFQDMISKHCSDCNYNFDWKKKTSIKPLPSDRDNKSRNVSVLVNNNANSILNESQNINNENQIIENDDNNALMNKENNNGNDKLNDPLYFNQKEDNGTKSDINGHKEENEEYVDQLRPTKFDTKRRKRKTKFNSHHQLHALLNDKSNIKLNNDTGYEYIQRQTDRKQSQPLDFDKHQKMINNDKQMILDCSNNKKFSDDIEQRETRAFDTNNNMKTSVIPEDDSLKNNNSKQNQTNVIIEKEEEEDQTNNNKPNYTSKGKKDMRYSIDIEDLKGKDMTKCACTIY